MEPQTTAGQTQDEKEFIERGAAIEHDRWARWQKYMFSKSFIVADPDIMTIEQGDLVIPKEFVDKWFRQIDTKYADLSEDEKESDRKETRAYIPIIRSIWNI